MKRIVVFVIAFSFIVGLFLEIEGKRKYVYAKSKVVRTPDGRLVLERAKNVLIKDDKLYYTFWTQVGGSYSIKKKKNLKEFLEYPTTYPELKNFDLYLEYGDYFYGLVVGGASVMGLSGEGSIYRKHKKEKKFKKVAEGVNFMVAGKKLYTVVPKIASYYDNWAPIFAGSSIYQMNLDGTNRRKIKSSKYWIRLYKSKEKVFYGITDIENIDDIETDSIAFFELNGKKIKDKIVFEDSQSANFIYTKDTLTYLKNVKKMIKKVKETESGSFNEVQVGTYRKGKWEYKTVIKGLNDAYCINTIDKYIVILHRPGGGFYEKMVIDLYDINGRFIHRLKKDVELAS